MKILMLIYKTFINNFPKIIQHISTVGKKNVSQKQNLLKSFSLANWKELPTTKKNFHSLRDCKGCAHHEEYNQLLSLLPVKSITAKAKAKKLQERNRVLMDRTNQVYI